MFRESWDWTFTCCRWGRLFLGEAHRAAMLAAELALESKLEGFRGLLVASNACAAKYRSRLGLCQPVRFCLCQNGFYAPAPVQPHRPGLIACFNIVVAGKRFAHTLSQVLGKSLHPASLVLRLDLLNFQTCLHVCQHVHRGSNRVKSCEADEGAYLEEEIVSQRLPQQLIPFLKASGLPRLNQLGHADVDGQFPSDPLLSYSEPGSVNLSSGASLTYV